MSLLFTKTKQRWRRSRRIRNRLMANTSRPRLTVNRSHKNITCQVIDDGNGKTIVSCSTLEPTLRGSLKGMNKVQRAAKVGEEIAKRAKEKGVAEVVFDRSWYRFHGRIKALAEAARKGGLNF